MSESGLTWWSRVLCSTKINIIVYFY